MHKLLNLLLVAAVLVSGFILYSLEHTTRGLEREASKFRRGIAEETENMRLREEINRLRGEVAMLRALVRYELPPA